MDCPVCKTTALAMSERHGIEIDYCPQCRGIWLDRGELDKLIDRASPEPAPRQAAAPPPPPAAAYGERPYRDRREDERYGHTASHDGYGRKRKKGRLPVRTVRLLKPFPSRCSEPSGVCTGRRIPGGLLNSPLTVRM